MPGNNTEMAKLYAKETVGIYQQEQSYLRGTVLTKGNLKGANQFVFHVSPTISGAVTRGINGVIPEQTDDQTAVTCTMAEYHSLRVKNNFNIYSSSPDQREIMQKTSIYDVNYTTDQLILTQFATTGYSVAAAAASIAWLLGGLEKLWANRVPNDGRIWVALTSKAWAQAMKVTQFASSDFVDDRPFMKGVSIKRWMNCKFFLHTELPGKTTASASCFAWHEDAVGHCINMGEMQVETGRDGKQDQSWARCSAYQGSIMIQDEGVVKMLHDDTAAL